MLERISLMMKHKFISREDRLVIRLKKVDFKSELFNDTEQVNEATFKGSFGY
jgi:hypothetical protein